MRFYGMFLTSFLLFSCGTQKISISNNNKEISYQRGKNTFKTQYLLDLESNNTYKLVELDEKPQPMQGEDQMIMDMYRSIKYPASARENNIQGVVLLETQVSRQGEIINISVNKSVHPDLDNEALRAYKVAIQKGFQPFVYNGEPMQFKYIFPVNFSFE